MRGPSVEVGSLEERLECGEREVAGDGTGRERRVEVEVERGSGGEGSEKGEEHEEGRGSFLVGSPGLGASSTVR